MNTNNVYDFDEIIDRRKSNSYKWDIEKDEIPMWVADMDFKTAPSVIDAVMKRAMTGEYGYNIVPDEWYDSYIKWWKKRHNFEIKKEWLIFCTGVLPAITSCVQRITNHGDNVLCQTPVYDMFFHSIENTGRHVLESPLIFNGTEYEVDYEDLENKLSNPLTTAMILCNPHNPTGKIWTKSEFEKVGQLCARYNVTVISDEIHCDLTDIGYEYIPFASVNETCANISITCISASKAFNIAGLATAAVVIPSKGLKDKVERGLNTDEVAEPNTFAVQAVVAAFNDGEEWLDQLRRYIEENKKMVYEYIEQNIPVLHVRKSNATYLIWIDCGDICNDSDKLSDYLRKEHKVYFSSGSHYRGEGSSFLRMNVACPKSQISEALLRLQKGIERFNN